MIDWTRATELRSEIGAAEFGEVVDLFLEEVECLLDRLRKDPRPELIEEDLHFLKGCAVNLGFEGLARLCLKGEIEAAEGNPSSVDLQPIFTCYALSKRVFAEGIAAGLAA